VRYIVIHQKLYDRESLAEVARRLQDFGQFVKPVAEDESVRIYEVTGFPQ
jgi:hypothetical protein